MALTTTPDLLTYLQDELEDSNPSAAQQNKYIDALDRAHKAIVGGGFELNIDDRGRQVEAPYIFSWAVETDPIIVNTVPVIETGTVNVANGSTSITFSSAIASSVAGYHLKINGKDTVYKIAAHTGGSASATLDGAYVETSNTAASYKLMKLDYLFAPSSGAMLMPVDKLRVSNPYGSIDIVSRKELENKYPLYKISNNDPKLAGVVKQTSTGVTLRLSHYSSNTHRLELYYIKVPSTLTTGGVDPILPTNRIIIPHLAAFYLSNRRDDDRAQNHLDIARRLFRALKSESEQFLSANDDLYGVIIPWPGR